MGWGEVIASSFLLVPPRGLWRWVTGMPGFCSRRCYCCCCCWMPKLLSSCSPDWHVLAPIDSVKPPTVWKKIYLNRFIAIRLEVLWEPLMLLLQIMTCLFTFLKFLGCLRNTSLLRHIRRATKKKHYCRRVLTKIYQKIMVAMICILYNYLPYSHFCDGKVVS